ncbi:hypothetical protein OH77DRAFT_992628 [Trametes cingulata]|nr:hypothetical protein OH77DRAFT_992628 [Trametes cingulata]
MFECCRYTRFCHNPGPNSWVVTKVCTPDRAVSSSPACPDALWRLPPVSTPTPLRPGSSASHGSPASVHPRNPRLRFVMSRRNTSPVSRTPGRSCLPILGNTGRAPAPYRCFSHARLLESALVYACPTSSSSAARARFVQGRDRLDAIGARTRWAAEQPALRVPYIVRDTLEGF